MLGGEEAEGKEGFLWEVTTELGVNPVERGRRNNEMHKP